MDLLTIINTKKEISAEDAIRNALRGLTPVEQLSKLVDFFQVATERDAQLTELIAEAWDYLNANTLWSTRYPSLEALKRDIDYDFTLKRILDRHKTNVNRKKGQMRTILNNWNCFPDAAIPSNLQPPVFSERILRNLASLCRICTLEKALPLLHSAVQARASTPLLQKHEYLLPGDILNVITRLKTEPQLQVRAQATIRRVEDRENSDGDDEEDEDGDKDGEGYNGGDGDMDIEDDTVKEADPQPPTEPRTTRLAKISSIISDEENREDEKDEREEKGVEEEEEQNEEDEREEDGVEDQEKQEEKEEEEEEEEEEEDIEEEGVVEGVEEEEGTVKAKSVTRLQCGCAPICSALLPRIPPAGGRLDNDEGLKLLEWSHDLRWANFCKNHLRRLAGCGLDMYTNVPKSELQKRLKLVLRYRADLCRVRAKKPRYFRRASRATSGITTQLGPYMYTPKKIDMFTFNAKQVFNRFSGCTDAWDTFQENGTINIDGVFSYILEPEIFKLIEEEFDMYLYHLRDEQDGQKRRGWMRHMFYSLVQQLVRQDPVYYALIAAARPDKNTWLICYPYYVKYQVKGESTGFAHFDINVDEFVKTGRGKNIIQGSLSLDDENKHSCTLVVPGFHHHIREWWARVKQRGQDSSGYTTNAKKIYLPVDQQDFGRLVPVPCKRGAVRITMPEILHGSTPTAKGIRRTLFNWYTGIRSDYRTLDMEEAETWNQVAQCHQSMEAPMKSTSGEGFRYGRPLFPFPGVTKLTSTGCVGDALIGIRRWDDIRVQEERDILLGADDELALQLAEEIRERLVQAFFNAFPYVRMNEERAYGDRSYFRNKYKPRPEAERDESSLSSEELSGMSLVDDDEDMEEIEEGDSEFE